MAWVSDITCVKVANSVFYLCVVIDLYSRKVISYSISENPNVELVMTALKNAYKERNKPENLIFHSDQGVQYASYVFRSLLREFNITPSYSLSGTPFDNAVAESFFASIKKEAFSRCLFEKEAMLTESTDKYITFSNEYRPHQRLGYQTPNRVEKTYYENKRT